MRKRGWLGAVYGLLFTWLIGTICGIYVHSNRYQPLDKSMTRTYR